MCGWKGPARFYNTPSAFFDFSGDDASPSVGDDLFFRGAIDRSAV